MDKGCKFRIYPTPEQEVLIDKTFGCCRLIYNHALEHKRKAWFRRKENISFDDLSKEIVPMKQRMPFLEEVDSTALQREIRHLAKAYTNWWGSLKKKDKRYGPPKFKKKHNSIQKYTSTSVKNSIVDDTHIKIPKLGIIQCEAHRPIEGRVTSATISKYSSGEYFVSFHVVCKPPKPMPKSENVIGIDVGIKSFATDSNGNIYKNPKYLKKSLKKLKRAQRKLSRRKKGSSNYKKQSRKVAAIYTHISNQRQDHHHKLSFTLVKENQIICVEDLNIAGMKKNHTLAREASDAAWGEFIRQLSYKAKWYGRTLVKVPRFFPSSQLCHCCGYKNPEVKNLSVRKWVCPECGATHERDVNAAINILQKGLSMLERRNKRHS